MRKLILLLICVLLIFTGCVNIDPVIDSLPMYEKSEFYTCGEFQDYTDYAKYYYDWVSEKTVMQSVYFSPVTSENRDELGEFLADFESWVELSGGELQENYDFDKTLIGVEDYFYIDAEKGFDNYSVYYFDLEAQILYYFHNNN